MARFSLDIIRIYNPLEFDYKYMWDGYWNTVPAKSYKDVPRYKAKHFFKNISQYLIGQMQIKQGNDLLKKRDDRGLDKILDKYQENRQIWDQVPKLNDENLLNQIAEDVLIGLVEEYGKDLPPETVKRYQPKPEQSNLDDQVFRKFASKIIDPTTTPEPAVVKPLVKKGENVQDK